MRPPVRFNHAELDALKGLPLAARVLYMEGIRPFMDYTNGVVGASTSPDKSISLQSLAEVLFVQPKQGRTGTGSRSRKQARGCLEVLVEGGLISSMSVSGKYNKRLVLKCVLATTDESVKNKQGTNRAQQQGTNGAQPKASNDTELGVTRTPKQGIAETPKQGTPPDPDLNTDTTVREAVLIPDDFKLDEQVKTRLVIGGVRLPVAEFFLDEFKAANESSGFASMSWAAEFVKYCKRWEWRYDKEHGSKFETGGRDSEQSSQSRASRIHEREKRLYEEALAREQGAEDLHSAEGALRSQVVVPYRRS